MSAVFHPERESESEEEKMRERGVGKRDRQRDRERMGVRAGMESIGGRRKIRGGESHGWKKRKKAYQFILCMRLKKAQVNCSKIQFTHLAILNLMHKIPYTCAHNHRTSRIRYIVYIAIYKPVKTTLL